MNFRSLPQPVSAAKHQSCLAALTGCGREERDPTY